MMRSVAAADVQEMLTCTAERPPPVVTSWVAGGRQAERGITEREGSYSRRKSATRAATWRIGGEGAGHARRDGLACLKCRDKSAGRHSSK
jgi:hypothetical protein